jgi:hypothetical protein
MSDDGAAWHEGGCHCGAVRLHVRVRAWEALDCNCSICTKKGFVHLIVAREDFDMLRGQDALATYTFGTHTARHHFCGTCGMHPFYVPRSHPDGFDVNVRCLDDAAVRARFHVVPFDGQAWEENVSAIR